MSKLGTKDSLTVACFLVRGWLYLAVCLRAQQLAPFQGLFYSDTNFSDFLKAPPPCPATLHITVLACEFGSNTSLLTWLICFPAGEHGGLRSPLKTMCLAWCWLSVDSRCSLSSRGFAAAWSRCDAQISACWKGAPFFASVFNT